MAAPVLATKLYIPPPPSKLVIRSRLIDRLNEGLQRTPNVTLISAPAGFGKTTLISEWVSGGERPTAWIALDENDNDPARFLVYLINAVQKISPEFGAGILNLLQSPQPLPIESILIALLNEITSIPVSFILVLDDYHMVDAKSIDETLAFIIEHLPAQMHLVVTTREDPALPIPRLRARGQLTELRAADLRFTPSEATEFLKQGMRLDLSEEDIAALEARTEGWIAGLQLAALSMQGHRDVSGFVREFAGDNRYVVDYLIDEVLKRQANDVRSFLLQTAVLNRLNGSLCSAVTGQPDGKARLEALERANFFLIPLDAKRQWYRYHHLFADVLRLHLVAEQPDQVPVLHRRASEWYEQNDLTADAIHHALAAKDFERAADLIEPVLPAMRRNRQEVIMGDWFRSLPDELFQYRPVLSVIYAHVLLASGELHGVETLLQNGERNLDTNSRPGVLAGAAENNPGQSRSMIVVDDETFRRLPGLIAIARAGLALAEGDVPGAVKYAQRALAVAAEDDHMTRGGAAGFLGLASWTSGDLEAAHGMFADGMTSLQKAGNIADVVNGSITLANIRIMQGRLREAMRTYERGLQLAMAQDTSVFGVRGTADMYMGMSELQYEHNELDAATQNLLRSKELGEHTGFPQNRYRWRVAMARIRKAQGDLDGALNLLDEAEDLYMSDFSPNVRPIAALKARVWIAQGRLDEALGWAREQGLSVDDDLSYLREFEHITLARILLARYRSERKDASIREAVGLLTRLMNEAEESGRIGHLIEILVLQALAQQLQGDVSAAHVSLERALTMAEPEGYVRIFLDEGADMEKLLRETEARGIMPDYVSKLLDAFETVQRGEYDQSLSTPSSAPQALIEPLSQRELEILRLLKTELSGPEIARELIVGLSTVRSHTKSIYSKLGVNSRRAAVRRAEELNLI